MLSFQPYGVSAIGIQSLEVEYSDSPFSLGTSFFVTWEAEGASVQWAAREEKPRIIGGVPGQRTRRREHGEHCRQDDNHPDQERLRPSNCNLLVCDKRWCECNWFGQQLLTNCGSKMGGRSSAFRGHDHRTGWTQRFSLFSSIIAGRLSTWGLPLMHLKHCRHHLIESSNCPSPLAGRRA